MQGEVRDWRGGVCEGCVCEGRGVCVKGEVRDWRGGCVRVVCVRGEGVCEGRGT